MEGPSAVIFDVGNVLFPWNPRWLYERLIGDDRALDAFLRDVVTHEWHFQHDAGRPFAETSAELVAQFPQHEALIRAWGPRFNETIGDAIPGMAEIVADLDAAGVPLFGITNFSGEFWRNWVPGHPEIFGRFRDVVVSGDEKLMKPDAAIYRLALARFGLEPAQAVFVDDNQANVEGASRIGIHAIRFTGAESLRADLGALGLPI
ncbi:MAG: HAD family phosphatase [Sphingomonadales bacterium]|nr:MAG: HAD family phosphatase [Sphingomonadales bacterium]